MCKVTTSFSFVLRVLASVMKDYKKYKASKLEVKLSLFADGIILFGEILRTPQKNY